MAKGKVREDRGQESAAGPGQVWKDCDTRSGCDRWLTILSVNQGENRATCSVMSRVRGVRNAQMTEGRATKVRLNRFRPGSTGYKLVSAVGAES